MMTTRITATYNDLLRYEDNNLGLYATPSNMGSLSGYYWASQPSYQSDVCVATPLDFLESNGYDSFCRDDDYLEACGNEFYSLDVATSLEEV